MDPPRHPLVFKMVKSRRTVDSETLGLRPARQWLQMPHLLQLNEPLRRVRQIQGPFLVTRWETMSDYMRQTMTEVNICCHKITINSNLNSDLCDKWQKIADEHRPNRGRLPLQI
jgi:hypothetical protein